MEVVMVDFLPALTTKKKPLEELMFGQITPWAMVPKE